MSDNSKRASREIGEAFFVTVLTLSLIALLAIYSPRVDAAGYAKQDAGFKVYKSGTLQKRPCRATDDLCTLEQAIAFISADAKTVGETKISGTILWSVRLGVTQQFAKSAPAPAADTDKDGVPDTSDKCPTVSATTPDGCPATPPPNQAPTISGTPATTVEAEKTYSFQPTASDPDGDPLYFKISNPPEWTSFSAANGELSGTPTNANAGTTSRILIAAFDPHGAFATLDTFSITVTQSAPGTATVSWVAPTQNTDGSALTNLSGFEVVHGTSADVLSSAPVTVGANVSSVQFDNLQVGSTHYFAVRVNASNGRQSALSKIVSKTIQ